MRDSFTLEENQLAGDHVEMGMNTDMGVDQSDRGSEMRNNDEDKSEAIDQDKRKTIKKRTRGPPVKVEAKLAIRYYYFVTLFITTEPHTNGAYSIYSLDTH